MDIDVKYSLCDHRALTIRPMTLMAPRSNAAPILFGVVTIYYISSTTTTFTTTATFSQFSCY